MSVLRDYKIEDFGFPDIFVGGQGFFEEESIQATNAILLGKTDRTNNFAGNILTVGLGENIQVAIDTAQAAGGGTVYLSPGTYNLFTDIVLHDNVHLKGVSRDSCIIDFGGEAFSVKILGSDAYTTGTVSISVTDTTVVGVGTTFVSSMIGQQIFLDDDYYEIVSITDTTHLEIDRPFAGADVSGDATAIASGITDTSVETLTIQNSTAPGIKQQYSLVSIFKEISVYECSIGLDSDDCTYTLINDAFFLLNGVGMDFKNTHSYTILTTASNEATTGDGFKLDKSGNSSVWDCAFDDNTGDGINIKNTTNVAFISMTVAGNGGQGVEMVSSNTDLQFIAVTVDNNTSDGYKLTATTDRVTISSSSILNNGGYGVNIAASSCDDNNIMAPVFSNNTSGDINDLGTGTNILPQDLDGDVQTFTSNGTWTKPVGKGAQVKVQVWGGGGSGGAAAGSDAGGGGGGGYNEYLFHINDLGATETVTIGNGGAAVTGINNGNVGGDTTFGSFLSAYGGGRGGGQAGGSGGGGGGQGSVGGNATTTTAGVGGNPLGGAAGSNSDGGESLFGGGGGADGGGSPNAEGGDSVNGGGGGGSYAKGGDSVNGGGGGGSNTAAGGSSDNGGAGGSTGAGSVPGGGGGSDVTSGAGGKGKCIVTTF